MRESLFAVLAAGVLAAAVVPSAHAADDPIGPLTGVVQEWYSKQPLAGVNVELVIFCGDQKELKTVTDGEGRFRFDAVPACDANTLRGARPGKYEEVFVAADWSKAKIKTPGDAGTLYLTDVEWPGRQFGSVCAGAKPAGEVALYNNLVVVEYDSKGAKWHSSDHTNGSWQAKRVLPWAAVLCLSSTYKDLGRYKEVNRFGGGLGAETYHTALRTTTQAELVRLRDGKRFKKKVTVDPPAEIDTKNSYSSGHTGDTSGPVRSWLTEIAAKER